MPTPAQLSAQIVELMTRWNAQQDQLADWLTGSPAGGPNSDGRYPLTNAEGETQLFLSLPAVINQVTGPAASAASARDAASLASSLAQAAKVAAEAARDVAVTAQLSAEAIRGDVTVLQANVAAKWSDVSVWHSNIGNLNDDVEYHVALSEGIYDQTEANLVLAEGVYDQLRADSTATYNLTVTARVAAEQARDAAQGFANAINPSLLATKAELQTALNALVDAAPGTLDTLNELAAALGDNPNFATTVTTQLAGKADLSHTHTFAQVTGLQTALDGKAALSHTHTIAQVTGLQTALDGKADLSHTHTITQVTGLQAALDGKQGSIGYTPLQQGGGTSQGTNKLYIGWATNGDGLRLQVDSTNFGKVWPIDIAGTASAVAWSGIVGPPSSFPPSAHVHAISDITNLQSSLDGKLGRAANQWIASSDGVARFYFEGNAATYYGGAAHVWRGQEDVTLMHLSGAGDLTINGNGQRIVGAFPTLWWQDINNRAFAIHVNSDTAYFMRGGTNSPDWNPPGLINGRWPMELNLNNGQLTLAAGIDCRSTLFVRAQGTTEGGEIRLEKGPTSPLSGDMIFDLEGTSARFFLDNGTTYPMFRMDFATGAIWNSVGHAMWHSGNFDPASKANTTHTHSIAQVTELDIELTNIKSRLSALEAGAGGI
jgi:hypothetical protein